MHVRTSSPTFFHELNPYSSVFEESLRNDLGLRSFSLGLIASCRGTLMTSESNEGIVKNTIPASDDLAKCKELAEPTIVHSKEPVGVSGYLLWERLTVSNVAGNLLLQNGRPLRARQVEFYIDKLSWRNGVNYPEITDPSGIGIPAPASFFAFNRPQLGIVIFQNPSGWQWAAAVDRGINQREVKWPDSDILFNVNDLMSAYGDNSGSFDVYLKILA